jgi:uncharacterized membrane protein YcaP (DUF421 family)
LVGIGLKKEAVVTYFALVSHYLFSGTDKISQSSTMTGVLSLTISKYKTEEILSIRTTFLLLLLLILYPINIWQNQ